MSLHPAEIEPVPAATAQVAAAAFRKGCPAMRMRDELGAIYDDQMFVSLYPARGQPGHSPWRLALVTVLQFTEGLSDRQAADAVRGRIDWKYALSLDLADAGFDHSVLCEFRARLVAGGLEQTLLNAMLARFRELGLLKARGRQRTDSTHVLAAVRAVNRLESVGETLRAALNSLAAAAPEWLARHADAEWPDRYGRLFEEWRLPKGEAPRKALGEVIGTDGHRLLAAVYDPSAPAWLRELPAVQTLRRAWVSQLLVEQDRITWRDRTDLPPASLRFDSPYDVDARYATKGATVWSGYKAHTIRAQSTIRPRRVLAPRRRAAQWDDMADLQAVLVNDDALDDELQDCLLLSERGFVQPAAHAFAERGQVKQELLGLGALAA